MNPKDLVGAKKSPLAVVPPSLVPFVAPAMAVGANKYGPFNWRAQKVQAMTYAEAAQRHILAWVDGQENAEDTNVHHLAHALAGLAILADAISADNWIDNRPPPGPTADLLRAQDKSLVKVVTPDANCITLGDGECVGGPCMHDPIRFLCGHEFGMEPTVDCGTAVHWSRVNGIEEMPRATEPDPDCNCRPDWAEHAIDCPLFHDPK